MGYFKDLSQRLAEAGVSPSRAWTPTHQCGKRMRIVGFSAGRTEYACYAPACNPADQEWRDRNAAAEGE